MEVRIKTSFRQREREKMRKTERDIVNGRPALKTSFRKNKKSLSWILKDL